MPAFTVWKSSFWRYLCHVYSRKYSTLLFTELYVSGIHTIIKVDHIPLYNIMSTLGYGLLPMLSLGVINIFFNLRFGIGIAISLSIALWSSMAAANFIDVLIKDTK